MYVARSKIAWAALTLVFAFPLGTRAEDAATGLDASSAQALSQTQALLNNSGARSKAAAEDPKAGQADQTARAIAGSQQNLDAIYGLSADVMNNLAKTTGGDPGKMNDLLNKAMVDPEGFAQQLTPEQKAKLSEISKRVPAAVAQPQPSGQ